MVDALPVRPGDEMVFLGDYIDRGPDSSGVVSFLIELKVSLSDNKLVFLKGNHEDMLLSYLELSGHHGKMFLLNGGQATVQSYGVIADNPSPNRLQAAMSARPPSVLPGSGKLLFDRALPLRPRRDTSAQILAGTDRRRPAVDSRSVSPQFPYSPLHDTLRSYPTTRCPLPLALQNRPRYWVGIWQYVDLLGHR